MGRTSEDINIWSDGKLRVNAWEFLRELRFCPASVEGRQVHASHSERRRWLQNKAVIINGERPGPDDWVAFPIDELIFFPKGRRRTTMR